VPHFRWPGGSLRADRPGCCVQGDDSEAKFLYAFDEERRCAESDAGIRLSCSDVDRVQQTSVCGQANEQTCEPQVQVVFGQLPVLGDFGQVI
jgi:hypothetical protein